MRQYKLFILLIQVVVAADFLYAGFERTAQPTSVFGRAFTGVAFHSEENIWLNPASIAVASSFRTSIFYSPSPFQLPQLTNYGLLVTNNLGTVNSTVAINSLGFTLYRESLGSFAAAYSGIPRFSFGLMMSVYHLSIERYGSMTEFGIDAGTIYSLTDQMNIGVAINNINGSSFGDDDEIPRTIIAGISYRVLDDAFFNIDLVKDVRYEITYRTCIEFSPHDIITLRTGLQEEPSRLFGGIGISVLPFTIDYGVGTHDDLGLTHSIGISFTP